MLNNFSLVSFSDEIIFEISKFYENSQENRSLIG